MNFLFILNMISLLLYSLWTFLFFLSHFTFFLNSGTFTLLIFWYILLFFNRRTVIYIIPLNYILMRRLLYHCIIPQWEDYSIYHTTELYFNERAIIPLHYTPMWGLSYRCIIPQWEGYHMHHTIELYSNGRAIILCHWIVFSMERWLYISFPYICYHTSLTCISNENVIILHH